MSSERRAEEFIFGWSNKTLPTSLHSGLYKCGQGVAPCLIYFEEVEAKAKRFTLQEARPVRLLEAPWSWSLWWRLDGNKWPLTPVSQAQNQEWDLTSHSRRLQLPHSLSHSHLFIFSSLSPPPWFGLTHQHSRHRFTPWRDPTSRHDLLTSSGKYNQQTAYNCQLLQALSQLQSCFAWGHARPGAVFIWWLNIGLAIYFKDIWSPRHLFWVSSRAPPLGWPVSLFDIPSANRSLLS